MSTTDVARHEGHESQESHGSHGGWSDEYLVKLANGSVLVMSEDELDDALETGRIGEQTPVVAPGGDTWTTLAKLGGLDDEE